MKMRIGVEKLQKLEDLLLVGVSVRQAATISFPMPKYMIIYSIKEKWRRARKTSILWALLCQILTTVSIPGEDLENKFISRTDLMVKASAVKSTILHLISKRNILRNILKHIKTNGTVPRTQGNKGNRRNPIMN